MPAPHLELGDLLDDCADRWRERVIEGCVAAGFPHANRTTCQVLRPLFETDGLPISEVGSRAGLAKSSMTTIVRHLEEEGFVQVETDPDDHRIKRLKLTPKARRLERAIDDGVTRLRHRVTATLGPQGREQLHKTLERLLHAL